ncbi:hypothetical protein FHS51_003167 [Sphingobium wenxiniae]|jgi:hypothetical protein|uniref:Uncharacterized protein n=1 Tax=Sphingobium baderi LL03 TaxID=1114964 RepID=T0HYI5_9SPHN|nr:MULTISPECIES: DUF5818 domain-containing protein [Sphingobium]EQB04405.1 hypothetical protein L485_04095 [Sphingobium baderi LL03]KMS62942.1 hypothetical protein V475_05790 [Sphingobium baderi LL03]MBB6192912.1 hypothetical protein [Sphingobium wenxiniae]WRD76923.1 DUF5818 domain-containing protein [Sphingobium baderi]
MKRHEAQVDETGRLLRDAAGFLLQRDGGGAYRLVLLRVPVDHVEKRVRIKGWHIGDDIVEVEGVAAA